MRPIFSTTIKHLFQCNDCIPGIQHLPLTFITSAFLLLLLFLLFFSHSGGTGFNFFVHSNRICTKDAVDKHDIEEYWSIPLIGFCSYH